MACRERIDDLYRLVDGELGGPALTEAQEHLSGCDACRDTYRLLVAEATTIRGAFEKAEDRDRGRRSGLKSWIVAAVLLLLAGIGLSHLHATYTGWAARQKEVADRPAPELLARSVTVDARDLPLAEYLEAVSMETGVRIELSDEARRRLRPGQIVDIPLSSPVRLGSILGLLHRFYELEAEVRNDAIILQ